MPAAWQTAPPSVNPRLAVGFDIRTWRAVSSVDAGVMMADLRLVRLLELLLQGLDLTTDLVLLLLLMMIFLCLMLQGMVAMLLLLVLL